MLQLLQEPKSKIYKSLILISSYHQPLVLYKSILLIFFLFLLFLLKIVFSQIRIKCSKKLHNPRNILTFLYNSNPVSLLCKQISTNIDYLVVCVVGAKEDESLNLFTFTIHLHKRNHTSILNKFNVSVPQLSDQFVIGTELSHHIYYILNSLIIRYLLP